MFNHNKIKYASSLLVDSITKRKYERIQSKKTINILILFSDNEIAKSQIYPFILYKEKIESAEISVDILDIKKTHTYNKNYNLIIIQPWIDLDINKIKSLIHKIRESQPSAKIAFLDSYAPTILNLAENLTNHVDFYIKKTAPKNSKFYEAGSHYESEIIEFYTTQLNADEDEIKPHIKTSNETIKNIILYPNFYTSKRISNHFLKNDFTLFHKPIDVHARLAISGTPWYSKMRTLSMDTLETGGLNIIKTSSKISIYKYSMEMIDSKLCWSPFGYGEICWRDFEAVMYGTLLLKPSMDHLSTYDNFYQPYETYIPIKWDFSDLNEKIEYYLTHENERLSIAENAYNSIQKTMKSDWIISLLKTLII